ncbi:MAG: SecC motif-containing protein [Colwellia sp.]|nr:MAG: SecC motif-containing protein [Colwellia sp.]
MNLEQALLDIGNAQDNELPIAGLEVVKANWSEFYPELERLIDQFIADDTSLTDDQQAILFFGTLLLAELKYSPALEKCLQLFARNDTFLTPLEGIFGDALTELTPTLFYNVVDGNTQALCNYIVDGHQAMYCKASAIEAVFAQYEAGIIDEFVLSAHVTRWIAVFSALPSSTNSFLISALADSCIEYQLDNFKSQFVALGDKNVFDEDRFKYDEVKAWHRVDARTLIESGMIQTDFNVVDTLSAWADDDSEDEELDSLVNEDFDDFDSLMGEGGLLANMLYDEKTILENSVPVSSLPTAGRNDPCPCGSGKKYKKCCLR